MIALREAWQAGLLKKDQWAGNLVAGLIVGLVALPLAMAFAIASGVRPENGLFTAIVAGVVVSVFGGTRMQIAGPTGAFVVILSSITARYGFAGLQVATLMAGAMLLLLGIARFGLVAAEADNCNRRKNTNDGDNDKKFDDGECFGVGCFAVHDNRLFPVYFSHLLSIYSRVAAVNENGRAFLFDILKV